MMTPSPSIPPLPAPLTPFVPPAVSALRCTLGESPRWDAANGYLYWVDIAAPAVWRWRPDDVAAPECRILSQRVGCVAPRHGGGLALALEDGIWVMDTWRGPLRPLGPRFLADLPDYRGNDGCVDAEGNWWVGTVDMAKATHDAALYRINADGTPARLLGGMTTANGAAFSPDGRTLYHADTPTYAIRAFNVDAVSGTLGPPRLFHQFPHGSGRPDGAAVDAEGCLWTALFGGGRVARLSPTGQMLAEVALPVTRPTMISFGGADYATAYVTSARVGLTEAQLADQPLAGGLFAFRVDVPGLAPPPFAG